MFDDAFFEKWLDSQAQRVMEAVAQGKAITSEEMMILVLKAQSNHFMHLDRDLRADMQAMDRRLSDEMVALRLDMDKRFEQVDKRFEQVDKRFDQMITRIDRFMWWSLGLTISAVVFVVNFLK